MKLKIGMEVTVTEPIEAYYSGYGGRPECIIQPGMVGIVAAVKVPSVRRDKVFFNCVDFNVNGTVWRIAAQNDQLRKSK